MKRLFGRQGAVKIVLGIAVLFVAVSGPASQNPAADQPHPTGLIPLSSGRLAELAANWPRITRVGLNPLGFERVNSVRKAKGKPALDPLLVSPLGREIESAVASNAVSVQAVSANTAVANDLPVSLDNSRLRFFPPIRDQGSLGSCASFATTYVQLSYMTAYQRDLDIRDPADDTNKYSPKWSYNMLNDGCDFGSTLLDNYSLLFKHGAATWAELPYDANFMAWCLDAAVWRDAISVRTRELQCLYDVSTDVGFELTKELLSDGYVLVFGTYINSWVFKTSTDDPSTAEDDAASGRPVAYFQNGRAGSHAMTIVGYNDAIWTDINSDGAIDPGEKGAFRIANSWGTGWGESGFTWLAYDALRRASAVPGGPAYEDRVQAFQDDLLYVLTARNGYSPSMVGEFTLSHAWRSQLALMLGVSSTTDIYPRRAWTPAAFRNQGGALGFGGTSTEVSGTFVFDFTDLLVESGGERRYFLGIEDTADGNAATLSAFKIIDLTTDPETEAISSMTPQTIDHQYAYPYVDYAYAGPAFDEPPELGRYYVAPVWGRPSDTFTFDILYRDPDGDPPTIKNLIVDGNAQPMSLSSGDAADGHYSLHLALAAGSHSFAFYFEDGRGEWARSPLVGAYAGPGVSGHILSSLTPWWSVAGDPDLILLVDGSDFMAGAVVTWNGADRPTTFVSASRLEAAIPAADLAIGREGNRIMVRSPTGIESNTLHFTVQNPRPAIASLDPPRTVGGEGELNLTVHGTGFVPWAVVRWNDSRLTTAYVGPTELRASLTSHELWTGGVFPVTVSNPSPGGGLSHATTFTVSDFTVTVGPSNASVSAGTSAGFKVFVTPQNGPFNAPVSLSCSGLPRGCTATFVPAAVTPGYNNCESVLTLKTSGQISLGSAVRARSGAGPPAQGLAALGAFLAILGLGLAFRGIPSVPPVARRWAAIASIVLAVLTASCGAGGGTTDASTPPGTYRIQIQASSGCLTDAGQVTLTVQ